MLSETMKISLLPDPKVNKCLEEINLPVSLYTRGTYSELPPSTKYYGIHTGGLNITILVYIKIKLNITTIINIKSKFFWVLSTLELSKLKMKQIGQFVFSRNI